MNERIHPPPNFIWVCCQAGAEATLKADVARHHAALRFSFSRPGFVTFRLPADDAALDPTKLQSAFARAAGWSVGRIDADVTKLSAILEELPRHPFKHLHLWSRHERLPGDRGFEPFLTAEEGLLGNELRPAFCEGLELPGLQVNRPAKRGDWVIDVILVDETTWWVGYHRAWNVVTGWPGGIPPLKRREDIVSRAFWKMEEALRWSRLPLKAGQQCIEIGSSPGGACQSLLHRGLLVIGLDPADMDPRIVQHANFRHVRARAADLKRKEFAGATWLFSDANIAPENTLAAVEDIVTNRRVNVQGMLLTLKLLDWSMAAELQPHIDRIRGWGYRFLRTRQLAFNRRELCVLAVRRKHILREAAIKRRKHGRSGQGRTG